MKERSRDGEPTLNGAECASEILTVETQRMRAFDRLNARVIRQRHRSTREVESCR